MNKITMAVLGFGQRGIVFSNVAKDFKAEVELVAVCEKNRDKFDMIKNEYHLNGSQIYQNENDFFSQGKLADILIISTMDQDHYRHTMKALDAGYDILLEKPIALTKEHIFKIKDKANKLNRKIAVAHVLRYTPFYQEIKKVIDFKLIGQIASIHQTENVGYLHYAHSYVRGNWHNSTTSSPMILAKSCHDIDIINYLMGQRVEYLSSFGSLFYFKKENMPNGAAKNCIDCKVECPFNAINFYEKNKDWMAFFTLETDVLKVMADRDLNYGKCVYDMNNNVVDHQVLNMQYENGTTASFLMTAFSKTTHRKIEIKGTLGEIVGDLEDNIIHVMPYGKDNYEINIALLTSDLSYHSGGDKKLLIDFVRAIRDNQPFNTDINNAVESHYLAFNAEESRLKNGLVIDAKKSGFIMDVTKHYVTIDVGASSGRIIVYSFNKDIKSHEVHRFKNKPYSEKNHLIWNFTHIMNEIYEGLTKAFQYESEISAIGIDTWGCDYGYIDFTGKLIQYPYCYRDLRTENIESITNKYFSRESLYQKTGIQHLRFNTIYQIVDDLINHKEMLSKANKLLMIPDLIAYHLTGIIKMELTNLSTTSFYDSINHEIIDEVNKLGYPNSLIPEVIKPGEIYGNILPHIAQLYDLKEVPVIAVCTHDTASAVHSLQLSKTDTYISSGTWSLIGKLLDKPLINNNTFKKSYTNEIGFNNKIRFLKNISGFWIKNLILDAFDQIKVDYDELDRLIEQTLDFDSIIDLDHNDFEVGENIVEKIQTHCRKTNQKVPHKLEEFLSLFNYSLVCKYRQNIEVLDNLTDYKTNQIFIIGGGASNSLINQMTADITGIKVVKGNNEATSLGNAFVLHQAINQIDDVTLKSLFNNKEKKVFLPKKDLTEVYKKYIKLMKGVCL